jgi:hypothetical protein
MLDLTEKQFLNILAFLSLFGDAKKILGQSPDYILEKFHRYIGFSSFVFEENVSGIHPILYQGVVQRYMDTWKPIFKK